MARQNPKLPENREEQDDKYNPAEQIYQEKLGNPGAAAGIDQLESFANDPKNHDSVQNQEENPDAPLKDGFYRPMGKGKPEKVTFKGFFKKNGAWMTILLVLLGGGGAVSVMFAPGLGIVQLKEILTQDLNDQLTGSDRRTDAMWRSRLKSIQGSASICSDNIKIRCRFQSMSERQINKYMKAGFEVKTEDTAFGRKRITYLKLPGGPEINDPQDLINARRDPATRAAMNRVFNPIYATMADSISSKVLKLRFKTSKGEKLTGVTDEELDKSLKENTTGDAPDSTRVVMRDAQGDYILDDEGNKIRPGMDGYDELLKEIEARNALFNDKVTSVDAGGKAVGGVFSGALKGVSVLGAADTACTVYNTARAVEAAAKLSRAIQLGQYAMVWLGLADQIKAGTATAEQVEYLGKKLTATDARETITDELSTSTGSGTPDSVVDGVQTRKNPFFGKNAFDSPGYKIAAYNEAPRLTSRSQQYMIGGGLTGTLSSVNDSISQALGKPSNIRGACGAVQNIWTRLGGLAIGVIIGIGSFGVSTVISVGASVAISFALPFLEAALADIIAGTVVGPATASVDVGDATFAGTSAILGGMAQARGMKPLSGDELEPYMMTAKVVKDEYIAQARYEAKDEPLNVMNQYSFLGSFARTLNVPFTKASSSVAGAFNSLGSIFSTSLSSLVPSVDAAYGFNPERYEKCNDMGYEELGIQADVFCNVRYGLSQEEMAMDGEVVLDYMLENNHIDDEGLAISPAFWNFMHYCVNREMGWGETGEEQSNDWMTGKACMEETADATEEDLSNFRIYTIDRTIAYAMDEEEVPDESEDPPVVAGGSNLDKVALAQKIVAKGRVSYYGDVRPRLEDIASGAVSGDALPCGVNIYILRMIDVITDKYSITLSDINRGCTGAVPAGSSTRSRHYAGNGSAMDIDSSSAGNISGRDATSRDILAMIMPLLSEAATVANSYSQVGQIQCGPAVPLGPNVRAFSDSCTHLHVDVPAWSDPNLQYSPGY